MDMDTLLHLQRRTNEVLLYRTGHSAQRSGAAWMEGSLGANDTHAEIWPSPFAVHLKLMQHC